MKTKSAILGINPEKEVRYDGQGDDNCLKVCQNPEDEKAKFGVTNRAKDYPEDASTSSLKPPTDSARLPARK